MSTNTALDDIKARVKGHTEGPWVYYPSINRVEDVPEFDLHRFDTMAIGIARIEESDADGHLVAAAPKLLAALEAVEALHYAREDAEDLFSADCGEGLCSHSGRDDECPTVTITPCVECSIPGVYYIAYPCPTLTAITDALA